MCAASSLQTERLPAPADAAFLRQGSLASVTCPIAMKSMHMSCNMLLLKSVCPTKPQREPKAQQGCCFDQRVVCQGAGTVLPK